MKKIQANAVFYAAILAEAMVILIHYINTLENPPEWLKMGYLWYNLVGCSLVVIIGFPDIFLIPKSLNKISFISSLDLIFVITKYYYKH